MADRPSAKPFDPQKSGSKKALSQSKKSVSDSKQASSKAAKGTKANREATAIPKHIANRMLRRVAIASGLPTFLGMSIFVVSFLVVSRGIADISPGLTLVSTAVCFIAGLVGLSYGVLSASWEDKPGSLLGFENIRTNIARMRSSMKVQKD